LATYMVISMPKRNSVACGVSHFIAFSPIRFAAPSSARLAAGESAPS
jgi:hypothetical protein